jgi:hypothetical protein
MFTAMTHRSLDRQIRSPSEGDSTCKLGLAPTHSPPAQDMPLPNATTSHALLLATVNDLSTPCFLAPAIAGATRCVRDRLVIVLFSRLFNTGRRPRSPFAGRPEKECRSRRNSFGSAHSDSSAGVSHTECWDDIQRLLTYVYVQATAVAQELDKVLLQVDVLLRGFDEDLSEDFGTEFEVVIRIEGGGSSYTDSTALQLLILSRLYTGPSTTIRFVHTNNMVDARGSRRGQRNRSRFSDRSRSRSTNLSRCSSRRYLRSPACGTQNIAQHGCMDSR